MIQVYSSLVRSSYLKIANQNNNLLTTMIIDDPTIHYSRSVENICIPMITRCDRLMCVLNDLEGNIMRLNGKSELQLTIEDVYDQAPSSIPQIESENRLDFKSLCEINRVDVSHSDIECVLATIHQF